eukprot:scaffold19121_cov66-Cyclotella_meneghiniana.AAC.4
MGNTIIGTQSEYLRLCGLALHDVSERAICWFNMLDSGFTAVSASTCNVLWCEFSHCKSTAQWIQTTITAAPNAVLQMPSIDNHFTDRHPST